MGCFGPCPLWYNVVMDNTLNTSALERFFEPLVQCLTQDVAQRIVDLRADDALQSRIDELASKANEGELSESEDAEYRAYVEGIDILGVLQAKARAILLEPPA